ncbi:hypothetical protein KP509_26G069500 [Ceratopteris richardii]|uniref:non-specific serine/threonine protein kinase n=2 Tax=Ceratopteris richardii TaxID=49495 RepID=A0A8T2RP25_CERRI|nr:hypothetical protein KP509_26G069500 [Ceratopteris richardii]
MQLLVKLRSLWNFIALSIICLSCTALAQTGRFISIDCGGSESYVDENGISWVPDSQFGNIPGNTTTVNLPSSSSAGTTSPLSTIRYFPGEQSKYCYVFNQEDHGVSEGATYLIRASFWAGASLPYHTQIANQATFKLLIDADVWDELSIRLPQTGREEMREIYVSALKDTIDVCLTGKATGSDIPFISSLVLRPLDVNLTSVQNMRNAARNRALMSRHRINYGAASNDEYIRYQEDGLGDPYDRIWEPNITGPILATTASIGTDLFDHPPIRVLQTAYESSDSFNISFSLPSGTSYHFTLYYVEISMNITMNGDRVFSLQVLNGSTLFYATELDLYKLAGDVHNMAYITYSLLPMYIGSAGVVNFAFTKQNGSRFGPIIAGLELFQIFDNDMSLGTNDDEVATLKNITSFFPNLDVWTGDPCLPYAYNWITCTNDSRPYISSISLNAKGLSGKIPEGLKFFKALMELSLADNKFNGNIPDLSSLVYLKILDLHNNSLTGPIPDFLGSLPALTTLNLDNNNLSGEVPTNLLDKVATSRLNLSFAGNSYLCSNGTTQEFCTANSSSNKNNNLGLIVGIVVGCVALALLIVLCIALYYRNPKPRLLGDNRQPQQNTAESHTVFHKTNVMSKANQAQEFSYHDIKLMTNDKKKEIGKGGFGPVYLGTLKNGKNVAVKVLSRDSRQGENEFLNEVQLLSRVHHKNLVSLVGYCIEAELVLVYEFMANGSLFDSLKGKDSNLTLWKDRLRIAEDAAEGLDYLHRGCDPSIIHRDVKSSNILLNKEFEGKISDFGISKSRQYDPSTISGDSELYTIVQGSFGYLDPAYAETHIATHSVDVYAFGIVLFELISGKPPMIQRATGSGEYIHIVQWAKPHIERGNLSSIVDPCLSENWNVSSMWKVVDIARMCVDYDRKKRPSMNEVKLELQSALSMELQSSFYDSAEQITSFIENTDVGVR